MITGQFLANVYGEEVQIDYHDVSLQETATRFPEATKEAEAERLAYPLILLNGKLAASGGCDPYQIMFLVDADRKEKGLSSRY